MASYSRKPLPPAEPKREKTNRAVGLYFLLPINLQKQVDVYLSYQEQTLLKKSARKINDAYKLAEANGLENIPNKKTSTFNSLQAYRKIIAPFVADIIKTFSKEKLAAQKFNVHYAKVPWFFAATHLLLFLYSVLLQDFFLASSFVVYGVLSTWILFSQKPSYWQFYLRALLDGFSSWGFTLLAVALLVPLVGWLSLDKPPHIENSYALFWAAVFAAPLAEELIFREVLYRAFCSETSAIGMLNGMALSSFLFAFAHLQAGDFPVAFLVYFCAGMILAFVRWGSGSLAFAMIAHALSNAALYWL